MLGTECAVLSAWYSEGAVPPTVTNTFRKGYLRRYGALAVLLRQAKAIFANMEAKNRNMKTFLFHLFPVDEPLSLAVEFHGELWIHFHAI